MVVHRHAADASRVELRRQTWGEGIGWFTQNSLPLHPGQLAQLRGALGGPVAEFPPATIGMNVDPQRPKLKIFAESA